VLIVIPAYNESGSIAGVIDSVARTGPAWDILVVNDCSTDTTAKAAAAGPAASINLCSNLGIGGAVQAGFRYALENGYATVVQVDGDGQHPAADIPTLLDALANGASDVAIGSRFCGKGSFRSTMPRRMGIRLLGTVCRLLTGRTVNDVTSGFRAYNRKAVAVLAAIYPSDYPEPESLVLFHKTGLTVQEVAVSMLPRLTGVSSIRGFTSVYYVVKVLCALLLYSLRPRRVLESLSEKSTLLA
jgi:glycosyltransferase involved in cell wall biosynthesis